MPSLPLFCLSLLLALSANRAGASEAPPEPGAGSDAGAIMINCGGMGGDGMRDDLGLFRGKTRTYVTDKYVSITKWQTRWGEGARRSMMSHRFAWSGDLNYSIPVSTPHYVMLYFVETYPGVAEVGKREFYISINGMRTMYSGATPMDVSKEAGGPFLSLGTGTKKAITPVNGRIDISLGRKPGSDNPMISAIYLRPELPVASPHAEKGKAEED